MKPTTKIICVLLSISALFAARLLYMCMHGMEEDGWRVCVTMSSGTSPMDLDLVGRTFPIDDTSLVSVTTISKMLNGDGSVESYIVHAEIQCRR